MLWMPNSSLISLVARPTIRPTASPIIALAAIPNPITHDRRQHAITYYDTDADFDKDPP
jgi:hypothetical protein